METRGLLTTLLVLVAVTRAQIGFGTQQGLPVQQIQVCSDAAWVTCFLNPCTFRRCRWFPQARCEMRQTDCGCRRAWMLNGLEINCVNPAITAMPVLQRALPFQEGPLPVAPASVDEVQMNPDPPSTTSAPITTTTRTPEVTTEPWLSCPPGVRRIQCLHDPCRRATCPAAPAAVCSPDYCGGCFANFFLNGMRVNCFAAPPPPIQTENFRAAPSSSFSPSAVASSASTSTVSSSSAPSASVTPTRVLSSNRVRSRFPGPSQNPASPGSSPAPTSDVTTGAVTSQTGFRSRSEVSATESQRVTSSPTSAPTSASRNSPAASSAAIGQNGVTSPTVRANPVTTEAAPSGRNQGGMDFSGINQQLGRFLNFGATSFNGFQQDSPSTSTGSNPSRNATGSDNNVVA